MIGRRWKKRLWSAGVTGNALGSRSEEMGCALGEKIRVAIERDERMRKEMDSSNCHFVQTLDFARNLEGRDF